MLGSHQSPVRSQLPQAGIGSSLGDNGRDQSTLVEVLVLLVRVKDEQNTYIPLVSHFEELFNGNGRGATNPAGSIRQYLRYSSLGKYNVEFVIRDWVDVPETEAFYAKGVSGLIGNVPQQEMFRDAMETIDEEFDFLEWFDYDTIGRNGEGNDGTLSVGRYSR
jgi:M6 family metalloprotease-like protein